MAANLGPKLCMGRVQRMSSSLRGVVMRRRLLAGCGSTTNFGYPLFHKTCQYGTNICILIVTQIASLLARGQSIWRKSFGLRLAARVWRSGRFRDRLFHFNNNITQTVWTLSSRRSIIIVSGLLLLGLRSG